MSNLSLPSVQIREIRLHSLTGYQGGAQELVETSSCGKKRRDQDRTFTQCIGCATSKAACQTILIQDSAVISHGPVGCSSCYHEFAFTYRVNAPLRGVERPTQRKIYSTNLTEKDTVYGGNTKLAASIREVAARTNANAIFVITTCAAGIIGDDVESVCDEAEDELGVPVVAIFCEGFRSKVWTTGFDAAYHGIARKLIDKPRADATPCLTAPPESIRSHTAPQDGRSADSVLPSGQPSLPLGQDSATAASCSARAAHGFVNVINFWGSDVFKDWLAPFGLTPNYITPYSTVNTLRKSGEAVATIQACSTLGSYLGAVLEEDFGVPELPTAPPYGVAQTDRWFRALGKLLGKEEIAEEIIAAKKAEFLPQIAALREKLAGKTAYVTGGAAHGHALLDIMGELGMTAVGAAIFHHDPGYDNPSPALDQLAQRVADYGDVPQFNVCNKQEFELVNNLNRLRPDVLLARHGGMTLWGAKLGIPALLVGDEHYGMGYEGILNYGERLVETIDNNEFVLNLAKHAINPYTRWWLDQSPDRFLKKVK